MTMVDPRFPHTAAGDGVASAIIGELITVKVTTAASGGAFLAVELTSPPGGGPPLHTHPSAEVFLILAGAFAFHGLDRGKPYAIQATPGDVVAIPGDTPHTYQTVSPTPGHALAILTPGDELERFFAEAGTMVDASAPLAAKRVPSVEEIARMVAIAARHGIAFLPAPAADAEAVGAAVSRLG